MATGNVDVPTFLYHPTRPAQLITAQPLVARMLLAGWSDTPATFQAKEQVEADLDPLGLGSDADLAKADAAAKAAEDEAIRAAELHKQTGPIVIAMLQTVESIEQLERIRGREASNPDHLGGRRMVMAALDARLNALIGAPVK